MRVAILIVGIALTEMLVAGSNTRAEVQADPAPGAPNAGKVRVLAANLEDESYPGLTRLFSNISSGNFSSRDLTSGNISEAATAISSDSEAPLSPDPVGSDSTNDPSDHANSASKPESEGALSPRNQKFFLYPPQGIIRLVGGMFMMQGPPEQPPSPRPSPISGGTMEEAIRKMERVSTLTVKGVSLETTSKDVSNTGYPADLAGMISQTSDVGGVKVQRRSPVALDPNVRGFKNNQIYTQADGAYWVPARRDLDTMLSKIDPGMIRNVTVLPGPYSVQYGPGLAFIDVEREPTPRSEYGFQTHFDTTGAIRTNGGQIYGRETASGGSDQWGFRMSYGDRYGSDYRAGNDLLIPSGYHNRDVLSDLSFDINPYQHVDFTYLRLDQSNTEYPCQFFDINYLGTYGFQSRIVDQDPRGPWTKLVVEGWYNHTAFQGDTSRKRINTQFPTITRIDFAFDELFPSGAPFLVNGTTQGNAASGGARIATTWGDPDEAHLSFGVDFRYLDQFIREDYTITSQGSWFDSFGDKMPHSWMLDPGVYADWTRPWTERWTTTLGARCDSVATRARASDLDQPSGLPGGADFLTQNDTLYAFYLNNQWKLNDHLTLTAVGGLGQRPPSLLDRYADGLFISSAQSGFTRIFGDPRLGPERDWQIDLGFSTNYEKWRSRVDLFHAWIVDYITFKDETVINFADARRLRYVNTSLGTLAGFDWFTELDLYPRLSTFARMSFVEGRDQEINQPLPAIPPLDSMIGIRLHDPREVHRWEIELAARIVDNQHRLGTIRTFGGGTTVLEESTPGFAVWHLSGYWNYTQNFKLVAGIDNLCNRTYQEHLDLRLIGPTGFPYGPTRVLSPGITPYFAVNWVF